MAGWRPPIDDIQQGLGADRLQAYRHILLQHDSRRHRHGRRLPAAVVPGGIARENQPASTANREHGNSAVNYLLFHPRALACFIDRPTHINIETSATRNTFPLLAATERKRRRKLYRNTVVSKSMLHLEMSLFRQREPSA